MKKLIIFTLSFTTFFNINKLYAKNYIKKYSDEVNEIEERINKRKILVNNLLVELNYIRGVIDYFITEANDKNAKIENLSEELSKDKERLEEIELNIEDDKYL